MVRTLKRTDAGSPLLTPEVATVQPNGGSRRVESPIEPIPPPGKAAATTGAIGTILLSTAPVTLSVAAGVMVVLYAVQLDPASAIVPDWWLNWAYVIAPVVGIVAGLAVGLTFGAMRPGFSGARQSDTQSSGELALPPSSCR